MITGIDHVVLLVEHLEDAISDASDSGFTVTPGGSHGDGSTHNALIAFQDGSYLELLAFVDGSPPSGHYFARRFQQGPGLADVALRSSDIDLDVQAIGNRGLSFPIPTHLARQRPDGEVASWRMSLPQLLHPGAAYPFLIQDLTDRSIRVPTEITAITHPNGAIGIAGFSMVGDSLDSQIQALSAILDRQPDNAKSRFQAGRGIATIPIDPERRQVIVSLQPSPDSAPERHLRQYGNSIYSLSLRTRPHEELIIGDGELLSPPALGGARIYLQ